MTTEIAVLNRLGIALATDSAVTIGGGLNDKVFDSADKLFELSPIHPVAVMINGNMDCLGVPWELIIKDFREAEGNKPRLTIKVWMEDFLLFVSHYPHLGDKQSDAIVAGKVNGLADYIKTEIYKGLLSGVRNRERPDIKNENEFRAAIKKYFLELTEELTQTYESLGKANSLASVDADMICASYSTISDDFITRQFAPHAISSEEIDAFKSCCASMLVAAETSEYTTGIVIAGYGTEGIFPAIESVEVEGRIVNILKYSVVNSYSVEDAESSGQVVSYAQTDVIERLLGGADPIFVSKTASFIREAVIEAGAALESAFRPQRMSRKNIETRLDMIEQIGAAYEDKYKSETAKKLNKEFTAAFDEMIALMPKQELVNLAEALVSITAVERKASADLGTVGGPIDVALITKHEGFVWIKRKQHFDPNLNPRYFWRRYGKNITGGGFGAGASWAERSGEGEATD